jgi:hypothetical protein
MKIKHDPAYVPHVATTGDGILVSILNELKAIHDHFDAQEEAEAKKPPAETPKKQATKP